MLRLRLLQKTGQKAGLAHYLAARQQQRHALRSLLPVRFLQTLGLVRQPAATRLRRNWVPGVWSEHGVVDAGKLTSEETLVPPLVVEALAEKSSEVRDQSSEDRVALMAEGSERLGQKTISPSPMSVPEITAKTNPTEVAQTETGRESDPLYSSSEVAPKGEDETSVESSNFGQFVEAVALETSDEVIVPPTLLPLSPILPLDPVLTSQNESIPLVARDELSLSFFLPESQEDALRQPLDEAYLAVNENEEEVVESTAQQDFVKDSEALLPFVSQLSQPTERGDETEAALSPPPPPPPLAVGKRRQRAKIEEVSPTSVPPTLLTNVMADALKPALNATASSVAEEKTEPQLGGAPDRPVSGFAPKLETTAVVDESTARDNRTPAYWHARLVAAAAREQQQTTATQPANRTHLPSSSANIPALPMRYTNRSTTARTVLPAKGQTIVTPASVPQPALPRQFIRPQSLGKAVVAEPLSSATRRFLTPLLGFDPATVPLYHNEAATHWTRGYQADALTDGEAIAIRSDYQSHTPEFLGVLAHELTHVARRQQPRFVPPIVRAATSKANIFLTPEWMGEEQIAHRVESRVRQAAQSVETSSQSPRTEPASVSTRRGADESASSQMLEDTPPENWGGLPAPWEPMPEMVAPVSAGIHGPFSQPQVKSVGTEAGISTAPVHTMFSPAAVAVAGAAPAPIQLAEEGRSLDEEVPSGMQTEGQQQVQPDLDDLARQVYTVLKRRLAAERRREYMV